MVSIGVGRGDSRRYRCVQADASAVRITYERFDDAPVLRRKRLHELRYAVRGEGLRVTYPENGVRLERLALLLGDEHVRAAARVLPLTGTVIGFEGVPESQGRPERGGSTVVARLNVEANESIS